MSPEMARRRAEVRAGIRQYFAEQHVLEVETPAIGQAASTDVHIDLFCTVPHQQTDASARFLQTSPELHMKRLLAHGYPDIYQMSRVFRADEQGRHHNPEFTMLEWYRHGFSMRHLMDDVARLCKAVLGDRTVRHSAYADLFREHAGLDPLVCSLDDVVSVVSASDHDAPAFDTLTDALQYVMSQWVEPALPAEDLVFVHDYPASQAVLATLSQNDPRVANRFELFHGGLELANGWEELIDPDENRARLEHDNVRRMQMGRQPVPVDTRFLDALHRGMPPCAGVALGVDRLVMLATGASAIDGVLTFPWDDA